MIFDSIKNYKNYKGYTELYEVLLFLRNLGEEESVGPNTVLEEGRIFCNPVQFVSKPESQCKYEAHRDYIDVHYILKGEEEIATADPSRLNEDTPYDETQDIGFYTGEADGRYLLKKGDFMVCYPSDAHKVGMMYKKPQEVEKIVVKIKAENL